MTHSVEEALMLANTIFLFSFRPSEIKDVFRIELPRPRDMAHPKFVQIQKEIMHSLDEEVEKMMRIELNAEEAKQK